jgi:chromosome condensin MukBEF ATPase and DNA-binding subunit MukB
MNRFNIFQQIHKGLRAQLYQTALQLQQTDFTLKQELVAALDKVKEIVLLFDEHADREDTYILPLVFEYEPAVWSAFEREHKLDIAVLKELMAVLNMLTTALTPHQRMIAGKRLIRCFTAFMAFHLEQMDKEEMVLNEILWRYYSDDNLIGMQSEMIRNTTVSNSAVLYQWMSKSDWFMQKAS